MNSKGVDKMMSRLTGPMFGVVTALAPVLAWANGAGQGIHHGGRM